MSNYQGFFDAVYYINLEKRKDRKDKIIDTLLKLELKAKREQGFYIPKNGYAGCSLSHLSILSKAKQYGYRNVLVFEDDAQILEVANKNDIDNAIDQLPDDWELFYLGIGIDTNIKSDIIKSSDNLIKVRNCTGAFAVCYNTSVYDMIIERTMKTIQNVSLDRILAHIIQLRGNSYLVNNPIITTLDDYSDTEDKPHLQATKINQLYLRLKLL